MAKGSFMNEIERIAQLHQERAIGRVLSGSEKARLAE
jgi:hypothetical protein